MVIGLLTVYEKSCIHRQISQTGQSKYGVVSILQKASYGTEPLYFFNDRQLFFKNALVVLVVVAGGTDIDGFRLSLEAKLYLILLPCAAGILLLFVIVVTVVFMYRRRRLTLPSASRPRMQMSLLNDDDHISTTQISAEANPANEANLPVYRPTTQAIKS